MKKKGTKKSGSKKRHSILTKVVFIVNIGLAILLLLSYLSPTISPEWSTIPAFLGLAYPFLAILNILFVLFWTVLFRLHFLLSFLALVAGYPMALRHFQLNTRTETADIEIQAKLMSFNVRMFDFYDWKQDKESLQSIIKHIEDQAPDILCLQEFYNKPREKDNFIEKIRKINNLSNHHVAYDSKRKDHAFGIATFSVFPILSKGEIPLPGSPSSFALFTDILMKEDTVRVYNLHLISYRFESEDYAFIESLRDQQDTREWQSKSSKMLSKLNKGFIIRARQADQIREHINQSPYPVIICGDFNDTPASFAYSILRKGFKDSFIESGLGSGQTYDGAFPSYRIDFMLHSGKYTAINYHTHAASGSDHRPISTYLIKTPTE